MCALFVLLQVKPRLLIRDTTAAGGDMGAHVWFPAFVRDHLLGDFRVAGWSGDFYAGFPAGQFYFPVPAVLVTGLDVVLPYNVAFKLVTVLGPILLPVAAALLLAALRAPRPTPALAAVGATAFLFFKGSPRAADAGAVAFNQRIMGGTLASTLAGEFSFTIALALALFFLAALAWALDRRRSFWVPALLGALVVGSHLVVAVFALVGALVVWLSRHPIRNLWPVVGIGTVAGLLTAAWSLPLVAALGSTTDMRYEPITSYVEYLFPGYLAWMLPFVLVALVAGALERRRATAVIASLTVVMGLVFRFWEDVSFAPVWNLRMLPFWYLGLFLLTAVGAAELVRGAALLVRRLVAWDQSHGHDGNDDGDDDDDGEPVPMADARRLAERGHVLTVAALTVVCALAALAQVHDTRGFLDFWARWNYSGVEETDDAATAKAYPEYRSLIDAMAELPPGRAVWEPSSDIDRYGTTLALTMLPYYTDGRISSLEGVYYESAGTTPYAFLTIAKLAAAGNASNPVRGFEYRSISDFGLGVTQLDLLGVRYYLAQSDEAKDAARSDPRLVRVASVPDLDGVAPEGWEIFEVIGTQLVNALDYQPVVVEGMRERSSAECYEARGAFSARTEVLDPWECIAAPWWDDATALDVPLAAGGPEDWQRVRDVAAAEAIALPEVTVTDIDVTQDSISFRVDEVGVPVVVKISEFPNWRAEGAEGPWRVAPNFMVVVPTSTHVTLEFVTTPVEWAGRMLSVGGLVGLGLLWWIPTRRPRAAGTMTRSAPEPEAGP